MASEGKKKETHVLMVAFAAPGHVNPMLRLGKRLVSKGINVTFAVNKDCPDHIVNSPATAGIHLEFYSDGLSLDADRMNMDHFMESIGEELLPLGVLEEIEDQGLIVKWSPQVEVLGHPSVGCFLTHCGWNSLIETITAGVPVIAYPKWTDQPTNAKLIDVLRVGVRLRPGQDGALSGEELEKCLEEVMVGPSSEEYKKTAAELKREAREAVASGGSSDRNIQWFVDEIIGYS